MADFSKLSDDDLLALVMPRTAGQDYSSMSNDDLLKHVPPPDNRGVIDKLVGIGGPRYQTWPERAAREMAGIPERAITAAASAPAGSREATEAMIPATTEAAMAATPMSRAPALFGLKPSAVAAPTLEELQRAASSGYKAARESGVTVAPEALSGLQNKISGELTDQGYLQATAPKTFGVLKEMTPPAVKEGESLAPIGIPAMEAMRRGFRKAGADYTESDASRRAINSIDEMLSPLSPELDAARANSAAGFRAEDVGARLTRAERQAAKSGSGANLDNAIRQKISGILDSDKASRGFSDDELAQMEKVVRGTGVGNVARVLSKLSPQHPVTGWPASVVGAASGSVAGPVGAVAGATVPPAVGIIAKIIAEKSTQRQTGKLDDMIRNRSPLYQDTLETALPQTGKSIPLIARIMLENQEAQQREGAVSTKSLSSAY